MIEPALAQAIDKLSEGLDPLSVASTMLGYFAPLGARFVTDGDLQTRLKSCLPKKLQPHCFAVADLTDAPGADDAIAYAGHFDRPTVFVASLAKLLPLYGAYRLRFDVQLTSFLLEDDDVTRVANRVRAAYRRVGAATETRPMIEDMFEATPDGNLDLRFLRHGEAGRADPRSTDEELDHLHSGVTPRQVAVQRNGKSLLNSDGTVRAALAEWPMHDELRLMAQWSDTEAAGICIQALGFPYLWTMANRSGLYGSWPDLRKARGARLVGGLALTGDYLRGGWINRARNAPATPPANRGNARSLAVLMTQLAQGRLAGQDSCLAIGEMLRKKSNFEGTQPNATNSPIGVGLVRAGFSAEQSAWSYGAAPLPEGYDLAVSKVGYINDDSNVCDAVLFRRDMPTRDGGTKKVCFVIVGLLNQSRAADGAKVPSELLVTFGEAIGAQLMDFHKLA